MGWLELEAEVVALRRRTSDQAAEIASLRAQLVRGDEGARLRAVIAEQAEQAEAKRLSDLPVAIAEPVCPGCNVHFKSSDSDPRCSSCVEAGEADDAPRTPIVLSPPRAPRAPLISDARHPGHAAYLARLWPSPKEPR